MKMNIKDFTIVPVLCPMGLKDCSPCKYASNIKVRNPPTMGTTPTSYGRLDCRYLQWYEEEYIKKSKEIS